ncbi:MAG TPA: methyltransferase domain-containing protein [Thermoanaerobaculia bacterium]|nr:methyltransferase domain-containing protein [Thermoanaerobaculia bacterium]
MALLVPPRTDSPELLDEHGGARADVERSLRDLRRINRWLGGIAVYRRLLRPFAPVRSILDLGAGSADLVESVPAPMRIALDCKIDHLFYLRDGSAVRRVVADAARLPFRERAVDVVTSAHFFHHFTPAQNGTILRESLRVAARGVAVNDTRRHSIPLLFVSLLGLLGLVGRITRYDAPASVRRGYTVEEARAIGSTAGAARLEIVRAFPFRFGIVLWK